MVMLVWPATLPQHVNRQNHSQQLGDGRLRSPTDVGTGKVRRRYSAAPRPVNADMMITTDQKARLEFFWDGDTDCGTLPFFFPAPGLDGEPLLTAGGEPLLTADGEPLVIAGWWLVQFQPEAPTPSFTPLGGNVWTVRMQWRVLP